MTKKLPTINLKGHEYVQVRDRILAFNEAFTNGAIETSYELNDAFNFAIFTATVYPDVANRERMFNGTSAGAIDAEKSLEKLETVAVGRGLAFMGIGVLEGISSADEMDKFQSTKSKSRETADIAKYDKLAAKALRPGDKLVSGLSKSTGKPWYAIQRGKDKVWLTQMEYEAHNGLPVDGVSPLDDGAPPIMDEIPY